MSFILSNPIHKFNANIVLSSQVMEINLSAAVHHYVLQRICHICKTLWNKTAFVSEIKYSALSLHLFGGHLDHNFSGKTDQLWSFTALATGVSETEALEIYLCRQIECLMYPQTVETRDALLCVILNAAVRVKATLWTCVAQMQIPRRAVMDNAPDGHCCEHFVFKR